MIHRKFTLPTPLSVGLGRTAGYDVVALREQEYLDGALAIVADLRWHRDDFRESVPVSINIPEQAFLLNVEAGEFFLKNYSEASPLAEAIIAAGLVRVIGKFGLSGYIQAPVCRLAESLTPDPEPAGLSL